MFRVTYKQIDNILRKITKVNGKSHVLHLPDGSTVYGKLSSKQKKLVIERANNNLKIMVDNLSHDINGRILEDIKKVHPEYWVDERILDLHYRVPYNTYIEIEGYGTHVLKSIDGDTVTTDRGINYPLRLVKAYLRQMSNMTDEEKKEFHHIASLQRNYIGDGIFYTHWRMFDWLNANHFDYRGLIPMSLAIKITEENNPYKQKEND